MTVSYVHGLDLISQNRSGDVSYYHYDGQHSTRQLTDNASHVTDGYTYDAFGLLLNRSGATENNYLYTGEQYDPNVGFYYLRARYYNQNNGRFLTMDTWPGSMFEPGSLHKYLYCKGNPVDNNDPSGHFSAMTIVGVMMTLTIIGILASNMPMRPRLGNFWDWYDELTENFTLSFGASFGIGVGFFYGFMRATIKEKQNNAGTKGAFGTAKYNIHLAGAGIGFRGSIPSLTGAFTGIGKKPFTTTHKRMLEFFVGTGRISCGIAIGVSVPKIPLGVSVSFLHIVLADGTPFDYNGNIDIGGANVSLLTYKASAFWRLADDIVY